MNSSGGTIVNLASREANLKRRVRRHLKSLGFEKTSDGLQLTEGQDKELIRELHGAQRRERLAASRKFLKLKSPKLLKHFASGDEVIPEKISPVLERISSGNLKGDLFRLASLTWSVPVSNGFGRRLRYLVWDQQNGKLIGLIAVGDPVFNMSVRDNLIGWNSDGRSKRLVNLMDAYVLGALPPYNALLAGKMVACLVRSREIYDDFTTAYGSTTGIISEQQKNARLLAVTTSSALGRSSVYNRLKLDGIQYFKPIGYTGGWGHFHIPDRLFLDLRHYLRDINHSYADRHRFGHGPNWRLRTTRAALDALGFKGDLLRHGIQRQVFLSFLARNAVDLLKTGRGRPDLSQLASAEEIGELAVERWLVPRGQRRPEYKYWLSENIIGHFGQQARMIEKQLKLVSAGNARKAGA